MAVWVPGHRAGVLVSRVNGSGGAEVQGRSFLTSDFGRMHCPIKGILANQAVVGSLLNVEKRPVGLEADLPKSWQAL
jgi:hypothetical protein